MNMLAVSRSGPSRLMRALVWGTVPLLWLLIHVGNASAVPSFARQTGEPCAACHVGGFGPQLTSFGRAFKLGGYTMTIHKSGNIPLSAMLVESYTHTKKALSGPAGPYDGTNNNWSLQELSLFAAGRISKHMGMFAQFTYSDIERATGMDNADVRYAGTFKWGGHSAIAGISVNNNPTLSDPWNTAQAWKFPYMGSELAPGPAAAPLLAGGLEQQVFGADAYAMIDNSVYASVGLYRTLSNSVRDKLNVDNSGHLAGAAPYVRLAWTHDWEGRSLMIGTFGFDARLQPDGSGTPTDRFTDVGVDSAYQQTFANGTVFSVNGSFINEHQKLRASFYAGDAQKINHQLNSLSLDASMYFKYTYGLTAAYFDTTGTRDTFLYAPDPDEGSLSGSPNSQGEILQADWTPFGKEDSWAQPWANVRLGLQYTIYNKFNGAKNNYDGSNRSASDNNTLFFFLWTAI